MPCMSNRVKTQLSPWATAPQILYGACARFNTEPDGDHAEGHISGVLMRREAGFQGLGPNAGVPPSVARVAAGRLTWWSCGPALALPRGLRGPGSAVAVASRGHSADCLRTTVLDLGDWLARD
jgi:hypothetical protein